MSMNANAPYHGRPGMTNQDAALAVMREMQRQGTWGTGAQPAKPPLSPQQIQSKLHRRAIWSGVFGVLTLGSVLAAIYDSEIGAPGTPAWIVFAVILGAVAIVEMELFLILLAGRRKLLVQWQSHVTSSQPTVPTPPQYSSDGRWWWNGYRWYAVASSSEVDAQSRPIGQE